ncbi:MAG: TetR/AcrR family transcriptional regulator [Proteobacteria bacterium]|nr:TetR/AcrR family transcriptional regulator [Pseudomonadota bacterium]MBU4010085.1 TetR/AcrR family transcriptional regulator [Pseudomonadota bacterium]
MKSSDTKQIILDKAVDLFYEFGFVRASVRDIVRTVGVTNSTIYVHFKNKDQILYTIIQDIGSIVLEELRKAIEKHDDPVECLKEMIFRQTCLIKEKRKELKIYIEEQYQLPKALSSQAVKQQRQIHDLYYNKFCELEQRGILKQGIDKTVMAFSVFAMMNWIYRWYNDNGRLSIEEIANQSIAVFFGGILVENSNEK